ncbi:MAG: site-specific DNA-methyltransferase [Armatimonadota bacterium]|nr:site-specific DNA-methyltransferase [Armatimonadota bacterium]
MLEIFEQEESRDLHSGFVVCEAKPEYATPIHAFSDPDHNLRLYHGDALHLLSKCKRELFDLVFADPPYFLSNGGITCHSGRMVSVNKGHWDEGRSFEEMHKFNLIWLRECQRVLKPNGTIFVSGTSHNIHSIGFAMQTLGFKILNDIAWHKVNPPPNLSCRYFVHATETIIWAKRDDKARHLFNYEEMKSIGDPTKGKQMQSLWRITPPGKNEKRYGKHPTQKPEALLDRIIRAASNPGDCILDPFCGSGTTGVVAARLKRGFIGFELDQEFIDLSIKRLKDEIEPPQSMLRLSEDIKISKCEEALV